MIEGVSDAEIAIATILRDLEVKLGQRVERLHIDDVDWTQVDSPRVVMGRVVRIVVERPVGHLYVQATGS